MALYTDMDTYIRPRSIWGNSCFLWIWWKCRWGRVLPYLLRCLPSTRPRQHVAPALTTARKGKKYVTHNHINWEAHLETVCFFDFWDSSALAPEGATWKPSTFFHRESRPPVGQWLKKYYTIMLKELFHHILSLNWCSPLMLALFFSC